MTSRLIILWELSFISPPGSNCGRRFHRNEKPRDLRRRPQMVNAIVLTGRRHELSVLGCQVPMAQPEHTIAGDRAPDHRTTLRPAFRSRKDSLKEALRYPQEMRAQRQIDVNECVGTIEALPG